MRLTLFWQLFIATLATVVFTTVLSVCVERWLTQQAMTERLNARVSALAQVQSAIIAELRDGNNQAVAQRYNRQRDLIGQISVVNAQGQILYPTEQQMRMQRRHRPLAQEAGRVPSRRAVGSGNWQENTVSETAVTLKNGETVFIHLTPRLSLRDVLQARQGTFSVRLLLLLLLSAVICYALSRSLSSRIHRLQRSVRQMGSGQYSLDYEPKHQRGDELAALGREIAVLARRLQDSEHARRQMLSDISHELRSPLARMDVAAELSREQAGHAAPYLDRIQLDIRRMNTLIGEIITIQSLQLNPEHTLNLSLCDIDALIEKISADVRFEYQHKNITWLYQRSAGGMLLADEERLYSAVENIMRNAFMHATDNGTVCVATSRCADGLHIDICDNGGGIDDDADCARIFRPFVRLDNTRQRKTGGHGLGLAIAKAVIEAHHGSIHAHNRRDGVSGLHIAIVLPPAADGDDASAL